MGQLIVRNVDDSLVRALRERAAGKGRSAEAEHREILRRALGTPETMADVAAAAARLRARIGHRDTDSAAIVRQMRDERAGLLPRSEEA